MPTTLYYVDPNHTAGSPAGTAANPWTSFGSSQMATVDAELATNPVTVYFSARAYGSDTNSTSTTALTCARNDTSSNLLTIDGMSKWNTNQASPSWSDYSGDSKHQITTGYPISTGTSNTKRSNITLRGFKAIATTGQSIYWRAGDNVTIEYNECTSSSSTHGPGLYWEYSDTTQISSSNILIQYNYVHDVYGEGLYFAGSRDTDRAANDGVTIQYNTVHDVGVGGGEPDLLEVKDRNTNVIIRGNICYNSTVNSGRDGCTIDGGGIIEGNFVYNCGRVGVMLYAFWNRYGTNRDGGIIRNNIVIDCGGSGSYSWDYGIQVAGNEGADYSPGNGDTHTNTQVYNNTVWSTNGEGIHIGSGCTGVSVRNNISGESSGLEITGGGTAVSTYDSNVYYKSGGGNLASHNGTNYNAGSISAIDSNAVTSDPTLVDTSTPYTAANFKLQVGSPAIDAGVTIAGASPDHFGVSRPQGSSYDIGAHEYESGSPPATVYRNRLRIVSP